MSKKTAAPKGAAKPAAATASDDAEIPTIWAIVDETGFKDHRRGQPVKLTKAELAKAVSAKQAHKASPTELGIAGITA